MTNPTADAIAALTKIIAANDRYVADTQPAEPDLLTDAINEARRALAALLSAQGQAGKPVAGAPTWLSVKSAPAERWLVTCRAGERGASISCTPDGEEWIAPDGRTTVTHHTYLPPTHWLCAVPPMAGGDLRALRDRLRAASLPDQELADDLAKLFYATTPAALWPAMATLPYLALSNGIEAVGAALALCERKLPGWTYILDTRPVDSFQFPEWIGRVRVRLYAPGLFAATFDPPVVRDSHAEAFGPTAPLAILLALLEAMIGKETEDG